MKIALTVIHILMVHSDWLW